MFFDLPKEKASIIKVFGIGGGGCNAVNHMFRQGIKDVNFVICNTDAQALESSPVPNRIQLGPELTKGRGAGNHPEMGQAATLESMEEIRGLLEANTEMVFITAGMGGGTGTGGAPVVARIARDMGVLTVGIVTLPFSFEGKKRVAQAREGIEELKEHVDSIIVIVNDKIREVYGNLGFSDAFARADDILTTAARGIAEIITITGYVNVDFEDVKTVLRDSGAAIMGTGTASGEHRAIEAVESALNSPLLNDTDIQGAQHVLLNITSGEREVLMDEISEITEYVQESAGMEADIIWGNCSDDTLGDALSVTVIATGFQGDKLGNKGTAVQENVVHDLGQKDAEPQPEADAPQLQEPTLRTLGSDADRMAWQVNGGSSPEAKKPVQDDRHAHGEESEAPYLKPAPSAFEGDTVGRKPGYVPYNAPERQEEQPEPDPNQISLGFGGAAPSREAQARPERPADAAEQQPSPAAPQDGETPYGWRMEPEALEPTASDAGTSDDQQNDASADLMPFAEWPEEEELAAPHPHDAVKPEQEITPPSMEWDLTGTHKPLHQEAPEQEPPKAPERMVRPEDVPLAASPSAEGQKPDAARDTPEHDEVKPQTPRVPTAKSEPQARGLRVRTVYPDGEWAKPPVKQTPPAGPASDAPSERPAAERPQEEAPRQEEPVSRASHSMPLDQPPSDAASGEAQLNDAEREAIIRRNEERRRRLRSMSMRVSDANVEELEGTPAYLRREIRLSDTPHSSEDGVSRYQLGEGNGGEFKRRNNSFLHDNVD